MELPFDSVIPWLGLYPKDPKTPMQKNLCTPMFIAVLFIIAKIWKQPKCLSIDEWIKNRWYINIMEYYAAVKKKDILTFCDSIDGPGGYYVK